MIVTLVLGRGNEVGTWCVVGIILVVSGCFMLPMRTFVNVEENLGLRHSIKGFHSAKIWYTIGDFSGLVDNTAFWESWRFEEPERAFGTKP